MFLDLDLDFCLDLRRSPLDLDFDLWPLDFDLWPLDLDRRPLDLDLCFDLDLRPPLDLDLRPLDRDLLLSLDLDLLLTGDRVLDLLFDDLLSMWSLASGDFLLPKDFDLDLFLLDIGDRVLLPADRDLDLIKLRGGDFRRLPGDLDLVLAGRAAF